MRNRILLPFGLLMALAICVASQGCNNTKTEDPGSGGDKQTNKTSAGGKKTSAGGKKKPTENPDDPKPENPPDDGKPETPANDGAQVVIEQEVPKGDGLLTRDPLDSEVPPVVPVVEMTKGHADSCLVKVGDQLPAGQLPDLAGKAQDLSKLFGDKLTVVVFFREGQDASLTELSDLAVGVASPLSRRGVKVVGVCERGAAATAAAICKQAGVSFPVLLDADGAYFGRLATGKMPRTYLLDNTGKILWFDIDYTRDTRHDLREALRALVAR
jgi:peroxiredoxin